MLIEYAKTTRNSTSYKGFGTGPPKGPKRYKSDDELLPKRGLTLGGGSCLMQFCCAIRLVATHLLGWSVLVGMVFCYCLNVELMKSGNGRFAFGFYGAVIFVHLSVQSFFALLEQRYTFRNPPPPNYSTDAPSKVALQISAYQEDPDYLRECLAAITKLEYPRSKLKVLLCIDGNGDDSLYMAEIFETVMAEAGLRPVFFRWDYNYHELPEDVGDDENGVRLLEQMIADNQFICLMQAWGGKREVMYTAFKALGESVEYVQVCDSDTVLDPCAMLELAWVLDTQPNSGAVGGDVQILNDGDSFISFLSSLRYWTAFNVERACQSYFGVVSCISGPLGMYRMKVVQEFLDLWSDQKFLGEVCTFGDDRHLSNRMLQLGYATKYTPRSLCLTETPATYSRWLSQQIRWSKSYFREWLFNALWWHKHHLWMVYESIVAGTFPFFVLYTTFSTDYSGNLWDFIFLLLTIQIIGLVKGFFAGIIRGDSIMLFMSFYSCLYVTSLLPGKIFAMLTIRKKGWGTSGRKTLLSNYNSLIPVVIWNSLLLYGLIRTLISNDYSRLYEVRYDVVGALAYLGFWVYMWTMWRVAVQWRLSKKSDLALESETENFSSERSDEDDEDPGEDRIRRQSPLVSTSVQSHPVSDELTKPLLGPASVEPTDRSDLEIGRESPRSLVDFRFRVNDL
eukprot:CAMPEP_0116044448 /NCGR_PEP_ID=MMETSP0321-20121206/27004_1 /TAXON_ID=163516 /ORGANISM="Leptocylindrus danicus var. danicus, Strain B650" /LENGTH=677 /DNA_ID=CAMNT_0003525543 /DNA_START=87 /DNA_END=2120 /DNA_ORIENTATION=-